jgi:hypothetical protein
MSGAIDNSDLLYTGENSSMDYFRNKARDFQIVLNNLDIIDKSLMDVRYEINGQDDLLAEWADLYDELQSKKSQFKLAAEAINLASNGLNALNVRFPQLSIPSGLGNPVPVVAVTAAIAGAAVLIYWSSQFIPRVFNFLDYLVSVQFADPENRQRIIQIKEKTNNEIAKNGGGSLNQLTTIVKWVVIAGGAYFAYKQFIGNKNVDK